MYLSNLLFVSYLNQNTFRKKQWARDLLFQALVFITSLGNHIITLIFVDLALAFTCMSAIPHLIFLK